MKKMKRIISLLLVFILMLSLVACGGEKKDPIKIGFEGWSSGADAYMGQVAIAVLQDYIDNVNANGGWLGRQVELVPYDISKDFSESINATNRLINQDKVTAIIGPDGSPFAIPLGDIVENAQIPLLPYGSNAAVTLNDDGSVKPYVFRACPVDSDSATVLASYVYKEMGVRRVATLIETTNAYCVGMGEAFVKAFTSLGGEIVATESYPVEEIEFRAQLTKLAESKPEYIFMPAAAYKEVGNAAKQLKELGFSDNIKILGTDGWYIPELMGIAGPELEGAHLIIGADMSDPEFADIITDYNKKHGDLDMELHIYALYALNALQFIEHAILEAGSTEGPAIRDALENIKDLEVSTGGKWTLDPKTHNPKGSEFSIVKVTDSQFKTITKYTD
ncbi:ABC transporter substrate-binding protein [Paratissierella segnis]|jgi:branched-chain amino acid transport system substrate-binding protein|uniref:ABC transporter substrate-binding protein n=1 Tax=Paratissierella segnis TaxID=2763679 RepID=A0A926IK24_9FIRM|nr:ABC transporter substrate-binding protein [Paratissierella segnis]MBC8588614.1 ABC transporter substrate-binding protein [Paratissierella segnis]